MTNQRAFAIILNVLAVLGPTAALYVRFGSETKIDSSDAAYLVPLVGGMVVSFVVGIIAARTLESTAEGFSATFRSLIRALQVSSGTRIERN